MLTNSNAKLSEYISNFYARLEKKRVPIHSVILYQNDRILSEAYYAPFKKNDLHRMFSITKSVAALAIGRLCDMGKLSLNDKIVTYFKDKLPETVHPYLAEMTIRDMLMMRTCYASTTYNKFDLSTDWVGSFFTAKPTHMSGTVFHYDTSSAHVLAALAERLSGMKLWDFFRSEFSELELSAESYIICDGQEVSMGGSGLVAKTEDLLKIGILLMSDGAYNGKQLLSPAYVKIATSNLTPNAVAAPLPSESCGYGYMIWQNERGSYVCYGMGGQFIIVMPKEKLILITTADTQGLQGGNQLIYDAFYEEIYDRLGDSYEELFAAYTATDAIKHHEQNATMFPLYSALACKPDRALVSSNFALELINNNAGESKSSDTAKLIYKIDEASFFETICVSLEAGNESITFTGADNSYTLPFSYDSCKQGSLPIYNMNCMTSAAWLDEYTLYLKTSVIDSSVGSVHIEIYFYGNEVTIFMKKFEETLFKEFQGHFHGVLI